MKTFVVCYCLLVGVLQVKSAPLSLEQKQKLQTYHKECLRESNVSESLIQKSKQGIYPEDPAFKNYLYCFSQKLGFQDINGLVQKDVFERKISGLVDDPAIVSRIVEQCTVQQDTPQGTSFNIAKCLREVAPSIEIFKVAPKTIYLPNDKAKNILYIHQECAAQNNLDDEVIEQAHEEGNLFNNSEFKNYLYCFSKKQGIQREDGTIDREVFSKGFREIIEDPAVVEEMVQQCSQELDTPENTALFVSKCIQDISPVRIELFPRKIRVPDKEAELLIKHTRACIRDSGVDKATLQQTRQGIFPENSRFKEFSFCMAKKAGILNEAGDIQIDVMMEKALRLINDSDVVQKLIDQCAVRRDTPQETAFQFNTCFCKNSPGILSLDQYGPIAEAKQIIKECAAKSGVSRNVVSSARKGDFQDDALLKQYFFCINKNFGILNEFGEYYNEDVLRKGLTQLFNAEEADRLIEKCVKKQDSPLNTTFEGMRCFSNEIPEATLLF